MKNDQHTKDFKKFYNEIKKEQQKQKNIIDKKYNTFLKEWISKAQPYKVGDVLEVIDNKRIKFQRLAIYDIGVRIFDTTPMITAYGWWLDKDNNPVKWDGSGYPLFNCITHYKMELSNNQTNISREDYEKLNQSI